MYEAKASDSTQGEYDSYSFRSCYRLKHCNKRGGSVAFANVRLNWGGLLNVSLLSMMKR